MKINEAAGSQASWTNPFVKRKAILVTFAGDKRMCVSIKQVVTIMNTLRMAFIPGAIAGIICVFTSWLWMGVIFHRFQAGTPATWRPEGNRSYALSAAIHFLACIAIATLFLLIARDHIGIFADGIRGGLRFAALIWLAIAAPLVIEAAIFINLHPWVVVGQALDWLTTAILACASTAWWLGV